MFMIQLQNITSVVLRIILFLSRFMKLNEYNVIRLFLGIKIEIFDEIER